MSETESRPAAWLTVTTFAVIYLVWGSTFLAIRVGVLLWPPLLMAGLRFAVAGVLMLAYAALRRERWPSAREWRSVLLLAVMLFVVDYGLLFWAERRVASSVAAVLMATIPGLMAVAEIVILRTQRMTWRLVAGLTIGLAGVAVMMVPLRGLGGEAVDRLGAVAILVGAVSWSIASVLTKRLPLPGAKAVSSGAQMAVGGVVLLALAAATGEMREFAWSGVPPAGWWSLVYLVLAGSILGFTAYVWLIHHFAATVVGTYAYVNPVVAVGLGFAVLHEPLSMRMVSGAVCVLLSVVLITTAPRRLTVG